MFQQEQRTSEHKVEAGGKAAPATAGPSISMPKGGGAIRGIGEKFSANPVTGTASFSVPIATSAGRSGFGPQLTLSYDSGSGNTPFGFGWSLSLPSISRKTAKGLPQYCDGGEIRHEDVFILAATEDLVPLVRQRDDGMTEHDGHGNPVLFEEEYGNYKVRRYRPRIEGLYARIERWMRKEDGDIHWRTISRDNLTTLYGSSAESRIAGPGNPRQIFSWLICESWDDKGNAMLYRYEPEDSAGIDPCLPHERNRTASSRSACRYPSRILYGNRSQNRDANWKPFSPTLLNPDDWLFEVVFDYGDQDYAGFPPGDNGNDYVRINTDSRRTWPVRPDPFSSYRSGFEVRTYRRCQRILMFHRFAELGDKPYLVRSTEFDYADCPDLASASISSELAHQGSTRFASFLKGVTQAGYVRDAQRSGTVSNGAVVYLRKSMPPVEFEYTKPSIDPTVRDVPPDSLENLPSGVDGNAYQWVDLDGEGLPGILTEQARAWFYKRNLSAARRIDDNGIERTVPHFGPTEVVAAKPNRALAGGVKLMDLSGNGQFEVVELAGPAPGFIERTLDNQWRPFTPFRQLPNIRWDDPQLRFIDLNGDGLADVLITQDDIFRWYPSLGEEGFDYARHVGLPLDDEAGPRLVFADAAQSVYLADMCGDGLTDLVRIGNGEVCYWPNLGYGRFGAKVTMDNAPCFDYADQFDQRRIRVADIDGSGASGIIYLGIEGVRLYFNQSGNRLSDAYCLTQFPLAENTSSVMTADLLGNGTTCLVWSSPLPADASRPMRYIDLMSGKKPHLLAKMENNLGAETHVRYAPSTRFYIEDKQAGKPWLTKLPFPVHVVERIETVDRISHNRFTTHYAYHHGFFDGIEREFRGFGMVEQWDTETFAALSASPESEDASNLDVSSHTPPVLTRSWFHTGVYFGPQQVSNFFCGLLNGRHDNTYYRPERYEARASMPSLDDTKLPPGLGAEEEREAHRALKGMMLRQEVYALDGTGKEPHPYTVTEHNYEVRCLQRQETNRHAVFAVHERETASYQFERNPLDPRIAHGMTLEVDAFGNALKVAKLIYGRRHPDPGLDEEDRGRQARTYIEYTENRYTNFIDAPDAYRAPLPCESRTYELGGMPSLDAQHRHEWNMLRIAVVQAADVAYEQEPEPAILHKRLIEHVRTLYRSDTLDDVLRLGELQSLAIPHESYKLAFSAGLISKIYGERMTDAMLFGEGGYVQSENDGNAWIPTGRIFYSPQSDDTPEQELAYARRHFFLPHRSRDPFHSDQVTIEHCSRYDAYDLMLVETRDPLGNIVTVATSDDDGRIDNRIDYRVLQPYWITDPNGNRAAAAFDALGLVAGTALMGKPMRNEGDSLEGFEADLPESMLLAQLADPLRSPETLLGSATTRLAYDLFAYRRTRHSSTPQPVCVYELKRDIHASEASAEGVTFHRSLSYSDGFGREIQKKVQAAAGPLQDEAGTIGPRWIGSGWTVYDNKGSPVRQFEPFFTGTSRFEFDVRIGVSPVLFYDPLGRLVAQLQANHTWEKVVFGPWQQENWDETDTILIDDPGHDADVGAYFRRLPEADYLPGWHSRRRDGALGKSEQAAARKAAVHAGTPTVVYADALGRPFLTMSHNRHAYSDPAQGMLTSEERLGTWVILDIEGNQRQVIDAKRRVIARYDYDMLGNRIHSTSMDAGEHWLCNDILGKPLFAWDSRGHRFRTIYDVLRRPVDSLLLQSGKDEILIGRTLYGESMPDPENGNQRGKAVKQYDQAGVVGSEEYDFKGNLLCSTRQFSVAYKVALDWSADVPLEEQVYENRSHYDAMNRPRNLITPDGSIVKPTYGLPNQLQRIQANLYGAEQQFTFVHNIDHDAKGQRTRIEYGNGVATRYRYDPLTFRLTQLRTQRDRLRYPEDCPSALQGSDTDRHLQNLAYTYDPMGNLTHIADHSRQAVYFRNRRVDPSNDYTYDALYRLIEATGREHLGQCVGAGFAPTPRNSDDRPHVRLPLGACDGQAMGTYLQRYVYDEAGNMLQMSHRGSSPAHSGWTRRYVYEEPSRIHPDHHGNRLSRTVTGDLIEPYGYEGSAGLHGNITSMLHLPFMQWDYRDQLQASARQRVNDGAIPETTWYVYDASGQRVRKVTERHACSGQTPTRKQERLYFSGMEIYREFKSDGEAVALERNTLHIMDGVHRIALVETRTVGDEPEVPKELVRFQFSNHLGSSSLELDDRGRIISYEEYFPYGSTSYQAVRSQTEAAKRYRYTGKERDEENGFYYHGARYYMPWLGRWCSADPLGLAGGANLFAYAKNSPVIFYDPGGTEEEKAQDSPQAKTASKVAVFAAGIVNVLKDPYEWVAMGKGLREARIALNIDEITAVATGGSWRSAGNKQFLDWLTNQVTKNAGISTHPPIPSRPQISLADELAKGPEAFRKAASELMTRRFSEVKELESLTEKAVQAIKNPNRSARTLADAVNKSIRGRIARAATDDAKIVAQALREAGFDPKTLTAIKNEAHAVATVASETGAIAKESGLIAKTAGLLAKASPVVSKVGGVLGKVATPVAFVGAAVQFATAKTTDDYIDASISATSATLMAAPHPVAKAAGAGMAAGQLIDHTLDVSKHSSDAGVYVYEKLSGAGLNDTASFVIGGAVTVVSIPGAMAYGLGKKVYGLGSKIRSLF